LCGSAALAASGGSATRTPCAFASLGGWGWAPRFAFRRGLAAAVGCPAWVGRRGRLVGLGWPPWFAGRLGVIAAAELPTGVGLHGAGWRGLVALRVVVRVGAGCLVGLGVWVGLVGVVGWG
jgi:hypothetical protein